MRSNSNDPKQPAYANQSGYEIRDISLPTILTWVIFLFLFIIGSSVVAYVFYLILSPKNTVDPMAVTRSSTEPEEPPSPQIQAYPKTEMRDFRVLEQNAIAGYGKYRGAEGRYRIPVDRALELTAERGFPKTESMSKEAAAPQQGETGQGRPGETSASQGIDPRNTDNKNAPIR